MALNKIDKKMIDDSFVQDVENVKNTASDLTVKLANTAQQIPYKNNKAYAIKNMTLSADTYEIAWMSENDVCYYIGGGSVLYKSLNYGNTKTNLRTFTNGISFVRELQDGELLVGEKQGVGVGGKVHKSSSNQTVWIEVVQLSLNSFIPSAWGVSIEKGLILLSEYGAQGYAYKVYKSTNNGASFTQILNIADFAANAAGAHVHGVAYDKYYERIWVAYGDGTRILNNNMGVLYSDDMGDTWKNVHVPYQLLNIWVFEERVIFISDSVPNGIYSYERINKEEEPRIEFSYAIDNKNYLTYLTSFMYKKNEQSPLIMSWNIEPNSGEANPTKFALATFDGKNFTEIWRDTVVHGTGQSNFSLIAPTKTGKYLGSMTNDKRGNTVTKIVGDYSFGINESPVRQSKKIDIDVRELSVLGNGLDETRGLYNAIEYTAKNNMTLVIPKHMTVYVKDLTISNLSNISIKCYGTIKLIAMTHGDIANCMKFVNCNNPRIEELNCDGNIHTQGNGTYTVEALEHILTFENCTDVEVGLLRASNVGGRVLNINSSTNIVIDKIIAKSNNTGIGILRILDSVEIDINDISAKGVGDTLSYSAKAFEILSSSGKITNSIRIHKTKVESAARIMLEISSADVGTSEVIINLNAKVSNAFTHSDSQLINIAKSSYIRLNGKLKGIATRKSDAAILATVDNLEFYIDVESFRNGLTIGRDTEVKNSKFGGKIKQISQTALSLGRLTNVDFTSDFEIADCALDTVTKYTDIANVTPSLWTNVQFKGSKFTKGVNSNHSVFATHYGVTANNVVFQDCDFTSWTGFPTFWSDKHGIRRINCLGFNFRSTMPSSGQMSALGEMFYNTNPMPAGYAGWICTSATGASSVFKGFGLIEA